MIAPSQSDSPQSPSPWRFLRHLGIVVLALALGAATTIAIAWQIARSEPDFDQSRTPARWSHEKGAAWLYRQEQSFGATRVRGQFASAAGAQNHMAVPYQPPPSWSTLAQPAIAPDAPHALWEEAFGWPQPALMSRLDESNGVTSRVIDGIVLKKTSRQWGRVVYLPTHPIWSGMILDSLCFAVPWWIVLICLWLLVRVALRAPRLLRRRRGRCPQCGYDLRGKFIDGCSECGWSR